MPKYEIKKLGIWSCTRTCAIVFALVYLGGFILFSLVVFAFYIFEGGGYWAGFGLNAFIIALPVGLLIGGIAGLGAGALVALIFNLLAPYVGGLDIDIEMKE